MAVDRFLAVDLLQEMFLPAREILVPELPSLRVDLPESLLRQMKKSKSDIERERNKEERRERSEVKIKKR